MFDRSGNRLLLAAACLAALLFPAHADAHLVTTGLGPVYDGIDHFFLSPGDGLPVIALALLAGLRGPAAGRRAIWILPVAWLAGGVTGLAMAGRILPPEDALDAVSLLLLGILVAADLSLPSTLVAAIAALLGALHGFLNGLGFYTAGPGPATLQLLGIAVVLFVLVTMIAAAAVTARPLWARTLVRVVGSWIAASGLLWVGWVLHGAK